MSAPPTQIVMLDFPPSELPEFMEALCSTLPGCVWHVEVLHHPGCPLFDDDTLPVENCTCAVARLVIVKRLQPTSTSGNGGGLRKG